MFVWMWLGRGIIKGEGTAKIFNLPSIREQQNRLPLTVYLVLLKHHLEMAASHSHSGLDF